MRFPVEARQLRGRQLGFHRNGPASARYEKRVAAETLFPAEGRGLGSGCHGHGSAWRESGRRRSGTTPASLEDPPVSFVSVPLSVCRAPLASHPGWGGLPLTGALGARGREAERRGTAPHLPTHPPRTPGPGKGPDCQAAEGGSSGFGFFKRLRTGELRWEGGVS